MLLNLLVNAEQAIGQDGRITIRGRAAGKMVELMVEDTGPGIPADEQERIFERFATGGAGAGLGLAIVRDLVQAHGGEVSLESAPGAGTVVRCRFPA